MSNETIDIRCLKNRIDTLVRKAGKMMQEAHLQSGEIFAKEGPANFVTVYDKQIQTFLIENLKEILPDAGFFGEEDTEGNDHDLNGYTFFIDPIDGTTNFVFDYQHSCVSLGLSLKGEMIAGWVYKPYTNEMWHAIRGEGAYLNERQLRLKDIPIAEGIVAFGSARYNDTDVDEMFDIAKSCFLKALSIRNGGSAALDLCRIASASNAAYFEFRLQPYDYAAASIIIEEAGGVITQIGGDDITLDRPCSIVAGTKTAAKEIQEEIRIRREK